MPASKDPGKNIKHLIKDKKYTYKRAVAAGINMARDVGAKIPPPKKKKGSLNKLNLSQRRSLNMYENVDRGLPILQEIAKDVQEKMERALGEYIPEEFAMELTELCLSDIATMGIGDFIAFFEEIDPEIAYTFAFPLMTYLKKYPKAGMPKLTSKTVKEGIGKMGLLEKIKRGATQAGRYAKEKGKQAGGRAKAAPTWKKVAGGVGAGGIVGGGIYAGTRKKKKQYAMGEDYIPSFLFTLQKHTAYPGQKYGKGERLVQKTKAMSKEKRFVQGSLPKYLTKLWKSGAKGKAAIIGGAAVPVLGGISTGIYKAKKRKQKNIAAGEYYPNELNMILQDIEEVEYLLAEREAQEDPMYFTEAGTCEKFQTIYCDAEEYSSTLKFAENCSYNCGNCPYTC